MSDFETRINDFNLALGYIDSEIEETMTAKQKWAGWGNTLARSMVVIAGIGLIGGGALGLGGITISSALIELAQKIGALIVGIYFLIASVFAIKLDSFSKEIRSLVMRKNDVIKEKNALTYSHLQALSNEDRFKQKMYASVCVASSAAILGLASMAGRI